MKKTPVFLSILASAMLLSSCNTATSQTATATEVTVTTTTPTEVTVTTTTPTEVSSATRITEVKLDLYDSNRNEAVACKLVGELDEKSSLENLYNKDMLSSDVVGLFGCPIRVELGSAESATLMFKINDEQTYGVPIENLIVLWDNQDKNSYEEIMPTIEGDVVSVEITKSGTYMLADVYEWWTAWGVDASEYAHDVVYRNDEYGFEVTIPHEFKYYTVSDYWSESADGIMELEFISQKVKDSEPNLRISFVANRFLGDDSEPDNIQEAVDVSVLAENAVNAVSIVNETEGSGYSLELVENKSFDIGNGKKGYIVAIKAIADESVGITPSLSLVGYYEYNEDTVFMLSYYIVGSENYDTYYSKLIDSLETFRYFD